MLLEPVIPKEEFRRLNEYFHQGLQKGYINSVGESRHDLPRQSQATINDDYCQPF